MLMIDVIRRAQRANAEPAHAPAQRWVDDVSTMAFAPDTTGTQSKRHNGSATCGAAR